MVYSTNSLRVSTALLVAERVTRFSQVSYLRPFTLRHERAIKLSMTHSVVARGIARSSVRKEKKTKKGSKITGNKLAVTHSAVA